MPVTRSATRTTTAPDSRASRVSGAKAPSKKRKNDAVKQDSVTQSLHEASASAFVGVNEEPAPVLVPSVLSFSFEEAKQHLVGVDTRFADLFDKMQCRPFQQLERVHPFRALVESILGQQISWLAARSIRHKFLRLFDQSIPEKPTDYTAFKSATSFFPSSLQVANADIAALKTAGLSTRKAEYVKDLAGWFADGRLSTEKLIAASDEELAEMLIKVRGIGRWTVDMFAIFSLRRPDILPVGDLGVQRGLIRWFLSLHSPSYSFSISPEKISAQSDGDKDNVTGPQAKDKDALPVFGEEDDNQDPDKTVSDNQLPPDISSVPPAAGSSTPIRKGQGRELPTMPTPFTPSINMTLNNMARHRNDNGSKPAPLPEGLSVAVLKGRLDGKKKIKGALLTPKEMEDLTQCWKPYRSIGVYYMWSLAEQK